MPDGRDSLGVVATVTVITVTVITLVGELVMPEGGGGGGAMIAEIGGLMSATGQLAQDVAFKRPGLETGTRFLVNALGGKAMVGGMKMINRLGENAFANAIGDYATGKYIKGITDALDPERCPK